MDSSMGRCLCLLLVSILAEAVMTSPLPSSSFACQRDFKAFLYDLNFQCPFPSPFPSSPIQKVDGGSFEEAVSSSQTNRYTAVLFYASWCPFSTMFQSKFSSLNSMFPQIEHLMVEQSSAMPSVFSRYGIHSLPALLIVNQTTRERYHDRKDLQSLINFYKRITGLYPVVDMVEETSSNSESVQQGLQLLHRASLKQAFLKEPYLLLSAVFVILRAFLFFFPEIASHLTTLWVTYIPRLNLAIFGESRQVLGHVLHLVDVKRIWSKVKLSKTRNFHKGARNAQVWASSLASVSLGKPYSSRILPSREL